MLKYCMFEYQCACMYPTPTWIPEAPWMPFLEHRVHFFRTSVIHSCDPVRFFGLTWGSGRIWASGEV